MFRIRSISLNGGVDNVFFDDVSTLVYGDNNTGKTLVFNIINYMLGTSDNTIWQKKGMDGVFSLEAVFSNDDKLLFCKRTNDGHYYYRNSATDDYMPLSRDSYISLIGSLIPQSETFQNDYYMAVDENVTYRSFKYLNFVDQESVGMINPVINEIDNYEWTSRIKAQMLFIFNKEKQKEINNLQKEKEALENKLSLFKIKETDKRFHMELIKENFIKLSLPFSGNLKKDKELFESYLNADFKEIEAKKTDNVDLIYYLKIKAQLETRIAIEKEFEKNKNDFLSSKSKIDFLISSFKNALDNDQKYSKYIKNATAILNRNAYKDDLLSVKDYERTIKQLYRSKKEVEEKIKTIESNLEEKNYVMINQCVSVIKKCFYYFESIFKDTEEEISEESLLSQIKEKNKKINKIKSEIKKTYSEDLNNSITKMYLRGSADLSFIQEDSRDKTFGIWFTPRTCDCEGHTRIDKENGVDAKYYFGSKARKSYIKAITYINLHKYFKETFQFIPVLPIMVIDGFNEPFQGDSFETVFEDISSFSRENNIQFIAMSHQKIATNHIVDLNKTNGLNSCHNKELDKLEE